MTPREKQEQLAEQIKRKQRRWTCSGLTATVLWLIAAVAFAYYIQQNAPPEDSMQLNEWGDYIAGVFAALAFFWLVIGFFQQGYELQLNTSALILQAEELQNSVEETRGSFKTL